MRNLQETSGNLEDPQWGSVRILTEKGFLKKWNPDGLLSSSKTEEYLMEKAEVNSNAIVPIQNFS